MCQAQVPEAWTFVNDPTAGIPAVIAEVQPDGNEVYYYREPNGSLIARQEGTDWHYYSFDALGSTRLITDSSGYVTDAYTHDVYGAVLSHDRYSGSIDQPYQYVGQLGYYTHYQEPNFALLQLGVRFYDAETGRFSQRDPVKDGINLYVYVSGRPLTMVDPFGLKGGDTDCPDCMQAYNRCISTAVKRFRSCIVETVGIADIFGCTLDCLLGCAVASAAAVIAQAPVFAACALGCGIAMAVKGGAGLIAGWYACGKPYARAQDLCGWQLKNCRHKKR